MPRPPGRDRRAPPAGGAGRVRGLPQPRPTASQPRAAESASRQRPSPWPGGVASRPGRLAPRLRSSRLNADGVLPSFDLLGEILGEFVAYITTGTGRAGASGCKLPSSSSAPWAGRLAADPFWAAYITAMSGLPEFCPPTAHLGRPQTSGWLSGEHFRVFRDTAFLIPSSVTDPLGKGQVKATKLGSRVDI